MKMSSYRKFRARTFSVSICMSGSYMSRGLTAGLGSRLSRPLPPCLASSPRPADSGNALVEARHAANSADRSCTLLDDQMNDAVGAAAPVPRHPSIVAPRIARRFCSKTDGQTIRLALAVSSSSVMNMTPLAEPGICRTSTSPAMEIRLPFAAVRKARHGVIALLGEALAQKRERMRAQAKARAAVILDDFAARASSAQSVTRGSIASGRSVPARSSAAAKSGSASSRRPLIAQAASRRERPRP